MLTFAEGHSAHSPSAGQLHALRPLCGRPANGAQAGAVTATLLAALAADLAAVPDLRFHTMVLSSADRAP